MNEVLAARIGELADMGWNVQSNTETTAALEMRGPINWWLLALSILLLFGLGILLYLAFWLATSRVRLFLSVKDGQVVESGDTRMVERQERDREATIRKAQEIKEKGYFKAMWPSMLALFLVIVLWFVWMWLLISVTTD